MQHSPPLAWSCRHFQEADFNNFEVLEKQAENPSVIIGDSGYFASHCCECNDCAFRGSLLYVQMHSVCKSVLNSMQLHSSL